MNGHQEKFDKKILMNSIMLIPIFILMANYSVAEAIDRENSMGTYNDNTLD